MQRGLKMDRITVVVEDNAVYCDKTGYSDLDLTSCQIPADVWAFQWENGEGWIEFRGTQENEHVEQIPAWVNACVAKFQEFDYVFNNPPPPTPEEITQRNKDQAIWLLSQSDWVMLPDVNIINKDEWIEYRAALRALVNNPEPSLEVMFPIVPEERWE
jgi:hypothetical protein